MAVASEEGLGSKWAVVPMMMMMMIFMYSYCNVRSVLCILFHCVVLCTVCV
jgi:hypothetical protein